MLQCVLISIGKTDEQYIQTGITKYLERLTRYCSLKLLELPDVKRGTKISVDEQKQQEAKLLLSKIPKNAYIVLLDENGKMFTSQEYSVFINRLQETIHNPVYFVIGGPYGFSTEMYAAAHEKISLSKMTFSHQMIRLFFVEQVYRAFSILNNLPYHHV